MTLLWVRMMCDRHSHRFMAPPSVHSSGPGANLSAAYFEARYQILREPLGFPPSAAKLPDDDAAIHAWIETKQVELEDEVMVVAVGRIHLIPADSTGACADTVDENAAHCPDFPPLGSHGFSDVSGNDFPTPESLRPAVQIRQMGTLENHQRKGYAATVLSNLECEAVTLWGKCTGFLQARVHAIPFYESQNWICFGDEYMVEGIGLHRSMWKPLNVSLSSDSLVQNRTEGER
jgi:hypothetical protein